MAKKILRTPISDEDLKDINIGDIVYLTGHIVTCRDVAHRLSLIHILWYNKSKFCNSSCRI